MPSERALLRGCSRYITEYVWCARNPLTQFDSRSPDFEKRISSNTEAQPAPTLETFRQARMLITETDGDGMTFLMHAASGCKSARTDMTFSDAVSQARKQQNQRRQQQEEDQQYSSAPFDSASIRLAGAASSLRHLRGTQAGLGDRSVNFDLGTGDSKSPDKGTRGTAAQTTRAAQAKQETQAETSSNSSSDDYFERLDAVTPLRESTTATRMPQREGDESAVPFLHGDTGLMNPALILFKTAWSLVQDMLWKEEVGCYGFGRMAWCLSAVDLLLVMCISAQCSRSLILAAGNS